ncbi:D-glycero-beta-D-manno-heptose 1,7-bisphosphate 7-phosphatase [Lysobacter terrae]
MFLDRDGVINHDAGYTHRWEDFEFVDGIFDLCRFAKQQGYLLVVVTNQAGIARGFYTEADFHALTEKMCERFQREGAPLDRVYFSPFHPEHGVGRYKLDSACRKPHPGMILRAADELAISLSESVLVGDKESDILAGHSAGVGCNLLLLSAEAPIEGQDPVKATAVVSSLEQVKAYLKL